MSNISINNNNNNHDESSVEGYDVIIIGCGPAGISTAIQLQQYNNIINQYNNSINNKKKKKRSQNQSPISYLILEARDRIGGRAYTNSSTLNGNIPVDCGASWIHHYSKKNPLYKYSKLFINPKIIEYDENYYPDFIACKPNGERYTVTQFKRGKKLFARIEEYMDSVYDNIVKGIQPDCSMAEVLKSPDCCKILANESEEIKEMVHKLFVGFFPHYEASNLEVLSAGYGLSDYYTAESQRDVYVLTGYGEFLKTIAQHEKIQYKLNTIVNTVQVDEKSGTISVNTLNKSNNATVNYKCKHVLVTVPLGCLKHETIKFEPALPKWKQEAINALGMGVMNKIILQFETNFWGSIESIIYTDEIYYIMSLDGYLNMIQSTDSNTTSSNTQNGNTIKSNDNNGNNANHNNNNILVTYTHGKHAQSLEKLTDTEIIEQLMIILRKIFQYKEKEEKTTTDDSKSNNNNHNNNNSKPYYDEGRRLYQGDLPINKILPIPIKSIITRWGSDPYSYGSYSNFKVHSGIETVKALAQDCYSGIVHFAGEHTNYSGGNSSLGCVDSAFQSGIREGKKIIQLFKSNSEDSKQ